MKNELIYILVSRNTMQLFLGTGIEISFKLKNNQPINTN